MSIINSFAVLGDEEEDVISTLIADAAAAVVPRPPLASVKKVEKAKVPVKPTHSGDLLFCFGCVIFCLNPFFFVCMFCFLIFAFVGLLVSWETVRKS